MSDKQLIYSLHAIRRMFERGLSHDIVRQILLSGKVIEEYPEDSPYPSKLILGWDNNRPLHVVIAENDSDAEIIVVTVYEPDLTTWHPDFERRLR